MVAILLLVIPLSQIGLDVYTPALPEMTAAFDASNELVQNTVTAYILGMSVSFIPTGLIADAVGRKRVLLAGAGLLALTSVGCAVAVNLTLLLGMRFIQGIGASGCLLMAAAIAADRFRGAKLVSVLGLLGAAWGAAPVLAPAVGGFVVAHGSWRLVFVLFAVAVAAVTLLVAKTMPETLPAHRRAPIDLRAAAGVLGEALRHRVFLGFVVMFGLIGAAQMVFGVVGPFLFEGGLGFSPAAYGLVALIVGTANLAGELACGGLAQRTTTRRLALAAWSVMILGATTLVVSAETVGVHGWVITLGAALVLCGIGVLDPQSKGLAMGVFDRNIGLIGGLVNTCCYLIVSAAMALMAYLPESSQAPLGWFYLASGVAFVVILLVTVRQEATPVASCSAVPSQPDSPR
ncbi:drug resistance transporter, Bcr/CflA subfamily [Mycolicibacterium rhodesiae NBB3]|jgi:DHA1 family bicyclomycin/chloramphenicol resistance-like MFS transporter|uniref:Drug resistance transporter, Bcr/CflA subfamily n=2 Tax=Mycolicibacterium rhodesiae TaxID=36814 RepID=G8RV12_MYCRN|nr:drug resistance transporter, Bcr/CflA subfamily [Mycolicibacterium rhodesiae NBB3]